MALNGLDPLLIVTLKNKGIIDFFGPLSLIGGVISDIGFPIPIYLSERVTGIYVDTATRAIDVQTTVDPVTTKDPTTGEVEAPEVSQTAIDSQVTVNLIANDDSILLTALLALMGMILDRLVSGEYSISYINGPTVVFGALLHRFATSVSRNDNIIRIELTLSTAKKESPTPKTPIQSIAKVQAAVPL